MRALRSTLKEARRVVAEVDRESMMGRRLSEIQPDRTYTTVYRGVLADVHDFHQNDYVTLSRRWARGHAEHVAGVSEEDAHVIKLMVKTKDVREAPNPGEYFYVGPQARGKRVRLILA